MDNKGYQTRDNAAQASQEKEELAAAAYKRFIENIDSGMDFQAATRLLIATYPQVAIDPHVELTSGTLIPQRLYCQGTSLPDHSDVPQAVRFAMADGRPFPAELALAGRCDRLMDGDSAVFTEQGQTLNLRIEWPGYDGWGAQIRIVNYQEKPKSISRAKLATEIAKQVDKFIEIKATVKIDAAFEEFRVGRGGIKLGDLRIASLERVSRGSWQICLYYYRSS